MSRNSAKIKALAKDKNPDRYMGDEHVAEFRAVLTGMLEECDAQVREAMLALREESDRPSDEADRCDINLMKEEKRRLAELLVRRRAEIEAALRRLEAGEYGYCEETGDEIGLGRLRANPLARLCIEAASRREYSSRSYAK